MTQTIAIFYAAYRNLNSRKLFWISLIISGLVVAAFAMVGINERGLTFATWQFDAELNTKNVPSEVFYKMLFVHVGISYWLSWIATILALISTAGIFPDLLTSGAVDLYVCRPISRLRLFLTEYVAGLLFVTLQVAVFSLASFLVLGLRGGVWEPGLFVAVPLVVCLFSYLFAVCVLLGVLTRSTVAALLLTLIFWFVVSMIGVTEQSLLMQIQFQKHRVDLGRLMVAAQENGKTVLRPDGDQGADDTSRQDPQASEEGEVSTPLAAAHRVFYAVKTVLPKTSDTVDLLQRTLVRVADLDTKPKIADARMQAAQREFVEEIQNRPVSWVVGTSLVFEAVMLALAAFVFCRRDF